MRGDNRDLERVREAAEEADYDPDSDQEVSDLKNPLRTLGFWGSESIDTFKFSLTHLARFAESSEYPPSARSHALKQLQKLVDPESTYDSLFFVSADEIGEKLCKEYEKKPRHSRMDWCGKFPSLARQYTEATARLRESAVKVARAGEDTKTETTDQSVTFDENLGDLRETGIKTLASVGKRAGGETLLRATYSLVDLSVDPHYPEQPIAIDVLQDLVLEADDDILGNQSYSVYRNQIAGDPKNGVQITPQETYSGICQMLGSALAEASSRGILPSKEQWTGRYTKRYNPGEIEFQNNLQRLVDVGKKVGGRWLLAVGKYLRYVAVDPTESQIGQEYSSQLKRRESAAWYLLELSRSIKCEHTQSAGLVRSTAVEPAKTNAIRIEQSILEAGIQGHAAATLTALSGLNVESTEVDSEQHEDFRKRARNTLLTIGEIGHQNITSHVAMAFSRLASREDRYPDPERRHARQCLAELCRSRPTVPVLKAYFSDDPFLYRSTDHRIQESTELFEFSPPDSWSLIFPAFLRSVMEERNELDPSVRQDALRMIYGVICDPGFELSLSEYQIHLLDVKTSWGEPLMNVDYSHTNGSEPLLIEAVDGKIMVIDEKNSTLLSTEVIIRCGQYINQTADIELTGEFSRQSIKLSPHTGTINIRATLEGEYLPWVEIQLHPGRQLSDLGVPAITKSIFSGEKPSLSGSNGSSSRTYTTALELPQGTYTLFATCPGASADFGVMTTSVDIQTDQRSICRVDIPFNYTHSSEHDKAIRETQSQIEKQGPEEGLSTYLLCVAGRCLSMTRAIPDHGKWFIDDRYDPELITQLVVEVARGISKYVETRESENEFQIDEFLSYLPEENKLTTIGRFFEERGMSTGLVEALGFRGTAPERRVTIAHKYLIQDNQLPSISEEAVDSVQYALFAADGFRDAVSVLNSGHDKVAQEKYLELMTEIAHRTPKHVVEHRDQLEKFIIESWSRANLTSDTSPTHIGVKALLQTVRVDERVAADAFGNLSDSLIGLTKIMVRTIDDPVWESNRTELCKLFEILTKLDPDRLRNEFDKLGSHLSSERPPDIRRVLARCLAYAAQGVPYVRNRPSTYLEYLLQPLESDQKTDQEMRFYCLWGIAELLSASNEQIDESITDRIYKIFDNFGIESTELGSSPLHIFVGSLVLNELAATAPGKIPTDILSSGIHEQKSRREFTRIIATLASVSPKQVEPFVPDLVTIVKQELKRSSETQIRCPHVIKALSKIEVAPSEELQRQYSTLLADSERLTKYYTCKAIHNQFAEVQRPSPSEDWLEMLDSIAESDNGIVSVAAQRAREATTGGSQEWVDESLAFPPESAEGFLERGHWFTMGIGRLSIRQYEWLLNVHQVHLHQLRGEFDDTLSLKQLTDCLESLRENLEKTDSEAIVDRVTHTTIVDQLQRAATQTTAVVLEQAESSERGFEDQSTSVLSAHTGPASIKWTPDVGYGTEAALDAFKRQVFDSGPFDPAPENPPETPTVPDGDFEIDKRTPHSKGGQATIERGVINDGSKSTPVAIKRPSQTIPDLDPIIKREAPNWQEVHDHPHIIEVYDIYEEGGRIVMEYLDGGDLRERCGDISVPHALWIGVSIADALQYAHRKGIKHLDVKPRNIVLDETDGQAWDWPKLGDWGLSQNLYAHSGRPNYTRDYAGPELRGLVAQDTDVRTDVYQLAATLYDLLGDTHPRHLEKADQDQPIPLHELNNEVDEMLDQVIRQGLETEIADRWASMRMFKIALLQAGLQY